MYLNYCISVVCKVHYFKKKALKCRPYAVGPHGSGGVPSMNHYEGEEHIEGIDNSAEYNCIIMINIKRKLVYI